MMMMMINAQSHALKITNSFNRQSESLLDMETIKSKALQPSNSLHDTQFHPSTPPTRKQSFIRRKRRGRKLDLHCMLTQLTLGSLPEQPGRAAERPGCACCVVPSPHDCAPTLHVGDFQTSHKVCFFSRSVVLSHLEPDSSPRGSSALGELFLGKPVRSRHCLSNFNLTAP